MIVSIESIQRAALAAADAGKSLAQAQPFPEGSETAQVFAAAFTQAELEAT